MLSAGAVPYKPLSFQTELVVITCSPLVCIVHFVPHIQIVVGIVSRSTVGCPIIVMPPMPPIIMLGIGVYWVSIVTEIQFMRDLGVLIVGKGWRVNCGFCGVTGRPGL